MSIFDSLPTVNKCCFCIDLKVGCILIAVFTILNFGTSSFTMHYSSCERNHGNFEFLLTIAAIVMFCINLLLFIASIVFLYGILQSIPKTATWYMYGVLFSIIANLIYVIINACMVIMNSDCWHYVTISVPTVSLLIWLYFILVVRSYQEEMS